LENGERIGTYDGHRGIFIHRIKQDFAKFSGVIWDIDVSWDTKTMVSSSGDPSVKVSYNHILFIPGCLQIWDVETGTNVGTRKVTTVGRSISQSFSGNLVAYTTTMVI
jgi:hypothetical protein